MIEPYFQPQIKLHRSTGICIGSNAFPSTGICPISIGSINPIAKNKADSINFFKLLWFICEKFINKFKVWSIILYHYYHKKSMV
jgi:hypothetical protein